MTPFVIRRRSLQAKATSHILVAVLFFCSSDAIAQQRLDRRIFTKSSPNDVFVVLLINENWFPQKNWWLKTSIFRAKIPPSLDGRCTKTTGINYNI